MSWSLCFFGWLCDLVRERLQPSLQFWPPAPPPPPPPLLLLLFLLRSWLLCECWLKLCDFSEWSEHSDEHWYNCCCEFCLAHLCAFWLCQLGMVGCCGDVNASKLPQFLQDSEKINIWQTKGVSVLSAPTSMCCISLDSNETPDIRLSVRDWVDSVDDRICHFVAADSRYHSIGSDSLAENDALVRHLMRFPLNSLDTERDYCRNFQRIDAATVPGPMANSQPNLLHKMHYFVQSIEMQLNFGGKFQSMNSLHSFQRTFSLRSNLLLMIG